MSELNNREVDTVIDMFEEGRRLGLNLPRDTPFARNALSQGVMPNPFLDEGAIADQILTGIGTKYFELSNRSSPEVAAALMEAILGTNRKELPRSITEKIPALESLAAQVHHEK